MPKFDIKPTIETIRRAVTQPRDELNRWQQALRYMYDLGRYGARQLALDSAPTMAAALAFRTLFGLLPVLVVGTILIKAVGGFDDFMQKLEEFFVSVGLDEFQMAESTTVAGEVTQGETLSDWLLGLVSQVQNINIAAITWVGVAVLVYSALSVMVTIESCFNTIYRAPEGRPWITRVPVYCTVLIFGPAAIALSMYVDSRFDDFVQSATSWNWLLQIAPVAWSFCIAWLIMFAFYRLVPNTSVRSHPALVGAFVAAILLELGKRTMGAYIGNALSVRQLYGSLGLIPLFMFWLYLMWLVVLFGLEVSSTIQHLRGRSFDQVEQRRPARGLIDPLMIVPLVQLVAERFHGGRSISLTELSEELGLGESTIVLFVEGLADAGVVHRLEGDEARVALARPLDQIDVSQLVKVGQETADEAVEQDKYPLVQRLRDAQRRAAAELSLSLPKRDQPAS